MARKARTDARALEPKTAADQAIHNRIRETKYQCWRQCVDDVVDAALKYDAERKRSDSLHRARLSKTFDTLFNVMRFACEARQALEGPVTNRDVEDDMRREEW